MWQNIGLSPPNDRPHAEAEKAKSSKQANEAQEAACQRRLSPLRAAHASHARLCAQELNQPHSEISLARVGPVS